MKGVQIQFIAVVNGFVNAAIVEEFLEKQGFKYENEIVIPTKNAKSKGQGAGPKGTRKHVTKAELAAVEQAIARHPSWDNKEIAKDCGVGDMTVNRIRNGTHCLQVKKGK